MLTHRRFLSCVALALPLWACADASTGQVESGEQAMQSRASTGKPGSALDEVFSVVAGSPSNAWVVDRSVGFVSRETVEGRETKRNTEGTIRMGFVRVDDRVLAFVYDEPYYKYESFAVWQQIDGKVRGEYTASVPGQPHSTVIDDIEMLSPSSFIVRNRKTDGLVRHCVYTRRPANLEISCDLNYKTEAGEPYISVYQFFMKPAEQSR